jgi:FkbM family methyltransferase
MKKIFLDCGTHLCESLKNFYNQKMIDEEFEIHTFEANPACRVEELIKSIPLNIKVHNVAVWVEDGVIEFNQENHKESKSGSPTDGSSSDFDGWGSSVNGIGFRHSGYESPIKVRSLNFSRFISELPDGSYVICKMDIEGSEFAVLRHLIETKTIYKIKELYVEFHDRFMENESEDSKHKIINFLENNNIKINYWH